MAFYISDANGNLTKYASSATNANETDLSDYYTISQVQDLISDYVLTTTLNTTLNSYSLTSTIESNYYNKTTIDTELDKYYLKTEVDNLLSTYQPLLTFDTTPTSSSTNPVTSGGVYTALSSKANTADIPTKVSELTNDSGYITNSVNDLTNYYTTAQTYDRDTIDNLISSIPKFSIEVVDALPTSDISTTTVYLVKSSDDSGNLYLEYIYVNNTWELLGSQDVDLTDYVTTTDLSDALKDIDLSAYYTSEEVDTKLDSKQDTLVFDSTPTDDSENVVTSDGVYEALPKAIAVSSGVVSTLLKSVVTLSEEQYTTLSTEGSIVVDGVTVTYSPDDTLYITDSYIDLEESLPTAVDLYEEVSE